MTEPSDNAQTQIDTKALMEMCRSGDAEAQFRALCALDDAGAHQAVPVILPLLAASDHFVREAAARGLGRLGGEHLGQVGPALKRCLSDPEQPVRDAAAEALGALRYIPARASLERVLLHDSDWVVRATVAEALGELGDARALGALKASIDDETAPVRAYVAMAIAQLGKEAELPLIQRRLAIERWPGPRCWRWRCAWGTSPRSKTCLPSCVAWDSELAYEPLNLVNDLLSKQTPAVVVARAAELQHVLAALIQRTGGGEFALEVQARLAALAQASPAR